MSWSFTDQLPQVNRDGTFFISVANGVDKNELSFDLTLKTYERHDGPSVEVTLVSVAYDRKADYTKEFVQLLSSVPDWASAVDCVAGVTSFVF